MNSEIARTCIARNGCKQHNKLCGTDCLWWIDLEYQLKLSGIPPRNRKHTIGSLASDTDRLEQWKRWSLDSVNSIRRGEGFYLWGKTGVGKTTIACALAMSYIIYQTLDDIRKGNQTSQLVMFVNVPDLLTEIKQGFNDQEASFIANAKIEAIKSVPLVIFDDIGAERPSEWVKERLLTLINERYEKELSTFFTSNLKQEELAQQLGTRIMSRVCGMSIPVEVRGRDRRLNR